MAFSFSIRRSNFHGLKLKALVEAEPPLMILDSAYLTNAPYFPQNKTYFVNGYTSGLFQDVWSLLEKKLNFSTYLYKPKVRNWNKIINSVHRKEVDVAVAPLTLTVSRNELVSFLPKLFDKVMVVAIPSTSVEESLDFSTFSNPFTIFLWIAILVTISVISTLKSIALERTKTFLIKSYKYWWNSLTPFFGGESTIEQKGTTSYNIIIISSLLCGYVIWIAYNAALTSELLTTKKTYPFNDLETLTMSNWKYVK